MNKTSAAERSEFPSQPLLTLFNLLQVIELPLFPGFSRKLFKKLRSPRSQHSRRPPTLSCAPILHSAICTLRSRNPYCTAVFCTVRRKQIFSSRSRSQQIRNQKPKIRNSFTLFTFVSACIHDFHAKNISAPCEVASN